MSNNCMLLHTLEDFEGTRTLELVLSLTLATTRSTLPLVDRSKLMARSWVIPLKDLPLMLRISSSQRKRPSLCVCVCVCVCGGECTI